MKTYIIYLEPFDDLGSTRDKIGWGKSGRIVLVWSPGKGSSTRKLDLKLLQRHCASQGAILGIVSQNKEVQLTAQSLGIPIYRSLRKAQRDSRDSFSDEKSVTHSSSNFHKLNTLRSLVKSQGNSHILQHPFVRMFMFIVGVVSFLSIALILLPSAKISLTPQSNSQQISLTVNASTNTSFHNLSGDIPTQSVTVSVEGSDSVKSSGSIMIPDQHASGEFIFTNLSEKLVVLPEGTEIRTLHEEPVVYKISQSGELKGQAGFAVSLPVQAIDPGTGGNIDPDTPLAIDGPLGLDVAVRNSEATIGGTVYQSPAPSSDDYERLYQKLLDTLNQSALDEASSIYDPEDIIIPSSMVVSNIKESIYSHLESQPSSELTLTLAVEYKLLIVSRHDIRGMMTSILDAKLPKGYSPQEGSIQITHLDPPTMVDENSATWDIYAERSIETIVNETEVVSLTLGLAIEEAIQRLVEYYHLSNQPQIIVTPKWWRYIPTLPFRITVVSN
jgi:hypothetical protein